MFPVACRGLAESAVGGCEVDVIGSRSPRVDRFGRGGAGARGAVLSRCGPTGVAVGDRLVGHR